MYIYIYAAANAEQVIADTILGKLEQAPLALESFPLCSNVPSELEIVGITRYRKIHPQPWRKIYEVLEPVVHVHLVFDSRCNVTGQFAQKILRGACHPDHLGSVVICNYLIRVRQGFFSC